MFDWIKRNLLLVIVVFLFIFIELFRSLTGVNSRINSISKTSGIYGGAMGAPAMDSIGGIASMGNVTLPSIGFNEAAPQVDTINRLVIQESNLSLLVKDVVDVRNKILAFADSNGGYMVNASTSNPQDAPTANISIRIPSDKLQSSLDYFHSLSIKVVSENLLGRDVTDQYVDIDKRIAQIERTMSRLEAILSDAKQISDITNLTQQILSYQNQIDGLKGQKLSLEKNAELARLTIYLSTDEMALPYAPSETFRPAVIFKLAVRSLIGTLRGLATDLIWILVYAVIWVPLFAIFLVIKKWFKSRNTPQV